MIKKLKNKLLISRKMLFLASVSFVLVFLTVAFIYIQRTSALGGSIFNNSLIISDFSTTPSVLPIANVMWNDISVPHTNDVKFNVSVRGRSGVVNYSFWSNCSGYDPNTIYNTASLQTVCNKIPDYSSATSTSSLWQNKIISFTYAEAGNYKPVILVERNGVFMHKSVDVSLKPYVDLSVESANDSVFTAPVATNAVGVYAPAAQTVNTINYGQFARLKWLIKGVPAAAICTPSVSSLGGWAGSGRKTSFDSTYLLGDMSVGGTYTFRLTCSYNGVTNYDELTINIPPKVELRATVFGFPSATSFNGQTIGLSSIDLGVPLNSIVTLNGWSTGADKCTLSSLPPAAFPTEFANSLSITGKQPSFVNRTSKGINGTTDFILTCTRNSNPPIIPTALTSSATIRVYSSSGNCAFKGNNTIQAMTFCKNSLVTLNGADNIQMTGSFVAKSFLLDNVSDNIRFFYDYNTGDKIPPGFKYLNIPSPKEVGNTGN